MAFISRAAQTGIDLEAQGYHPDKLDLGFVSACLKRIPAKAHDWATRGYIAKWDAAASDVHDHRRDNVGRNAANSWIRRVLEIKRLDVPGAEEIKKARV